MAVRRSTRISQSAYLGPFRVRLSAGRSGFWGSLGVKTGRRSWTSVSSPLGRSQRGRRGR
jgi:hypothetical protein